ASHDSIAHALYSNIPASSTRIEYAAIQYDMQADRLLGAADVQHQHISAWPVLPPRRDKLPQQMGPINAPWGPPETKLRETKDKIVDFPVSCLSIAKVPSPAPRIRPIIGHRFRAKQG